jgi:hypothetical protein
MKEKLLELLALHLAEITAVQVRVRRYSSSRVQSGVLLNDVKASAQHWFDEVQPALGKAPISQEMLGSMSQRFETLLRLSKSKPGKSGLLEAIQSCVKPYQSELIHTIEINSFSSSGALSIAPYIEGLSTDEGEYLAEAQRCLDVNALRACIVLGWCATIARIHMKIEKIGYDKFSQATVEMAGKTTGRFKFFTKKLSIQSKSELQTIFDTDLLWVLEYLQLIDNNQHQRLRHCFEFRNNSAHPGLAPIKGANLYSFYSDISEIVLKNPKLELSP